MNKRLSDIIILEIFNSKETCTELSVRYNICRSYVNSIKTGRSYSNITGKEYKIKNRPKLTDEKVLEIYNSDSKHWWLSKVHDVNMGTIHQIKKCKIYLHVTKKIVI